MRVLIFIFMLLWANSAYAGTVTIGSWCERFYRLYTPVVVSNAAPVIIVLHPGLSNAEAFENQLGLDALAESMGAFVVYVYGTGFVYGQPPTLYETWNASNSCCGLSSTTHQTDLAAIRGIIHHVVQSKPIDPSRVYLFGYSNGGMMAYTYLCNYPTDTITLNGSTVDMNIQKATIMAGALIIDFPQECKAGTINVPVTHIYDLNDAIVPPLGGPGGLSGAYFPPYATYSAFLATRGANFTLYSVNATGCPLSTYHHCFPGYSTGLAGVGTSPAQLAADMITYQYYLTSDSQHYLTSDAKLYKVRE